MVIRLLAGALVATILSLPAAAQTPGAAPPASAPERSDLDWRRAGGDLFPASAADTATSTSLPRRPRPGLAHAIVPTPVQPYADSVAAASAAWGLDPRLVHAVVVVESGYRREVCSSAGACGLTQLMPATARDLGVADRLDAAQNLHGGARYLAEQIVRFGDIRLALAAYNAGPARVARLGQVPDIPETRAYVATVIDCYLALAAGRTVRSARDCAGRRPS